MLCSLTKPTTIPYFNAPIYLENKTQIGKVDEILGPINEVYFTVKMENGMVASSFKKEDKVFIGGDKLLPIERFLPKPKVAGAPGSECSFAFEDLCQLVECRSCDMRGALLGLPLGGEPWRNGVAISIGRPNCTDPQNEEPEVDVAVREERWADEGVCAAEVRHEVEEVSAVTAVDEEEDEAASAPAGVRHGVEVRRGVGVVIDLFDFVFHVHLIWPGSVCLCANSQGQPPIICPTASSIGLRKSSTVSSTKRWA